MEPATLSHLHMPRPEQHFQTGLWNSFRTVAKLKGNHRIPTVISPVYHPHPHLSDPCDSISESTPDIAMTKGHQRLYHVFLPSYLQIQTAVSNSASIYTSYIVFLIFFLYWHYNNISFLAIISIYSLLRQTPTLFLSVCFLRQGMAGLELTM